MATPLQSLLQTVQVHLHAGRRQQAAEVLMQIVEQFPQVARAPFMLGVLAHQSGQPIAAIEWLTKSLAIDSTSAETYFVRGMVYQQNRQLAEAVVDYRECLIKKHDHPGAMNNLGRAILDQGDPPGAMEILRKAVALSPTNAGAWNNLGDALRTAGKPSEAIVNYKRAIAIDPNCAEAHGNLGALLAELGDGSNGIACMQRAVAINPRLFNAHLNLARTYITSGSLDEAMQHCTKALELRPDSAAALDLMANALGLTGHLQQCIKARHRAMQFKPDDAGIHSNLLMSRLYMDDFSAEDNFAAHVQWSLMHAAKVTKKKHEPRPANRRLRIGYVSPNFNAHSVAYFFEPVLDAHDRSVVEIYCYSNLRLADAVTARIRASAENWREIAGQSDADVAEMILSDQIDVLIDLAGHTSENRLPVFAAKPAPVQMTWLGYPATTGLAAIDYRITDDIADPPRRAQSLHTEQLLRIPGGCWAYQAPESPPIPASLAAKNGFITFGSFNNLPKITPRVLETWASILKEVPDSRLILKATGFGSTMARENVQNQLGRLGIRASRVELLNWMPTTTAHLRLYDRIDIALDTFPYNGTTTTCEAMWMGVPVITFPGDTHAARVGVALLTHAGCSEWVAPDLPGYVRLAVRMAGDLKQLGQIRASLRKKMQQSNLCNARRLAKELEKSYAEAIANL